MRSDYSVEVTQADPTASLNVPWLAENAGKRATCVAPGVGP